MSTLNRYAAVWVLDFEFHAGPGDNPTPVCLVAHELKSGHTLRLWQDQLPALPFAVGPENLFVAFYASAEWNCFLALGWPLPTRCLDLYAEFRNLTNNRPLPAGYGLLGALTYFGLPGITAEEKTALRELVLTGGPWDAEQRRAILTYCETDVSATVKLLDHLAPRLDWPRALLRGRYTQAVARMETNGIPLDTAVLADLRAQWEPLQTRLIAKIDQDFGVFAGTTFKQDRWAHWLDRHHIPWPRLPSGHLALDDETFKERANAYPGIAPLRELRVTLNQLRLASLAVGRDGRNRCLLSPFRATTGRNQPSTTRFIFGPATWMRGLIKPPPGYGLAYLDWSQQEFGIAAALSRDPMMRDAYTDGDPYLAFAQQAGAVPPKGTKVSHPVERDRFKACALAVLYGMGANTLAQRIGQPLIYARRLLELHRTTYPVFWTWSDAVEDYALLHGCLWTVFGWQQYFGPGANKLNPCSIRNFPMQANGAEMLRLACCLATEAGITVCAPVHDALLIQAPLERLEAAVRRTQELMAQASQAVLGDFALRSEAVLVRYPDRYRDERGARMWAAVWEALYGGPEGGEPRTASE